MTEQPEADRPRHTTQEERDRAMAVSAVPDETRVHAGGDETEMVEGAGGDLRNVDEEDRGGV